MKDEEITPPASVDADALLSDAERRRKIEQDLARMGMSPVEIRRLLEADANSADPLKQSQPKSPVVPSATPPGRPANAKATRPSAESLASFAAQLRTSQSAAQVKAVEQAALGLPDFRQATAQETLQAEALMRDAAMLRRREKYGEAEQKCRQALQLAPQDAAALEFLGDLLQGVARIDEALAAYKRAMEADPRRSSAERKYGDLLMQQQRWNLGDPEAVPKNALFAVLLSLLCPGLGQFHNGEIGKGVFFLLADAICVFLLAFSPWGFGEHGRHRIDAALVGCIIFTVVVYLASAIDANAVARQGGPRRGGSSGWDV